jgi:ubiquinone/menaquinone biosynthesis C-methylase UbiE
MAEHWRRIYAEDPEVFATFARAEDPEGRIAEALARHAGLAGRAVLEVGAGTGRLAQHLAPSAARWIALEPAAGLQARMAPGPLPLRALGQVLPLRTASLDLAMAAWVLGYLGPDTQRRTLAELDRVIRPGGGTWAVENAGSGDFQALRGVRGLEPGAQRLVDDLGFRPVVEVPTEIRFESEEEAARVLGALCGPAVQGALEAQPRRVFSHTAVLLFRPS